MTTIYSVFMTEEQKFPKEINTQVPKKPKRVNLDHSRPVSAIYRLSPRHRKFVLALRRHNWIQRQAYMEVYPNHNLDTVDPSASKLMNRPDIKEALEEMYDELNVRETETFEKVLARFSKIAERGKRDSDRIAANLNVAKLQRHMPDESQKTNIFIASEADILSIRESLKKKGKLIEPEKSVHVLLTESTTQQSAQTPQHIVEINDNSINTQHEGLDTLHNCDYKVIDTSTFRVDIEDIKSLSNVPMPVDPVSSDDVKKEGRNVGEHGGAEEPPATP